MNEALMSTMTLKEVEEAVFSLGATKSPGPYGLNGMFFQHHWDSIQHEVYQEVRRFFHTGHMHPEMNKTHITLIPKVPNPENLTQFRPISLCNSIYKVISKVMANRLKIWLPEIIAAEQSAFMRGRQIQDNIMIVQEVLHQIRVRKRKRKFQAVLKLDMQKAYDQVEWDFLEAGMKKMGFCDRWVSLIMACVTSVTFKVKLNGEPLDEFRPSRGIRQCDPFSPYLFIIVANVLSCLLHKAERDGSIEGIKLNRNCPTLTHLLFADDAIFFLNGKVIECQNLASVLNQYCLASGQTINLNKCDIFFSKGCPETLKQNMAVELRVPKIN